MSNDQEVGFYALITADVLYHPNLSPAAKLFYGTLTSLARREGFCWASNKYFEDLWKVDERTIQRWLEELKDEGFIEVEIDKKGMVTKRRIYPVFQKSSATRQKCPPRHDKQDDKNVPLDTANLSGHHIIVAATDIDDDVSARAREGGQLTYEKSNGEKASISESDIYRHFLKLPFKTELIAEAILIARKQSNNINNILKYLESVCSGLQKQESTRKKSQPTCENPSEDPKPTSFAPGVKFSAEQWGVKPPEPNG